MACIMLLSSLYHAFFTPLSCLYHAFIMSLSRLYHAFIYHAFITPLSCLFREKTDLEQTESKCKPDELARDLL